LPLLAEVVCAARVENEIRAIVEGIEEDKPR
jgi:hypothetical protein